MFESTRTFKLWDYNVSHQQLLFRSPRTGTETDNLDVVFWGVKFVSVCSEFDRLSIQKVAATELESVMSMNAVTANYELLTFRIESTDGRGLILASGCKVLRNQLEIFDSSLVYFDRDRPTEEYGDVLVRS